jgi:hypothetical protein
MHRSLAALLVLLPACYRYQPPPPGEPRNATSVDASMGATWDAVIDLFATRSIPIRTIERVSGIIAADLLSVDSANGLKWADCDTFGHRQIPPNTAISNVLVRGDSTSSTVRTSVRWSRRSFKEGDLECTSRYVWERALEQDVKERSEAEYRRNPRHASAPDIAPQRQSPPQAETTSETAASGSTPAAPTQRTAPDLPPGSEVARSPADGVRTNDQLMANVNFRRAVGDVMRLAMVTGFRELRPDTLTVELDDGAFTSASTEYNLGRLYLAYRGTTDYSGEGALELEHDGRRVGLYVPGRLTWEAVR